ncbi:SIMPL domain-containing protein [Candidatus Dojkabacteria bacterium]|uniref:SIMPL domain-containing protein n=1 Tax=Candidatus Dojkabacteria bacterium TaxID=2099670 RepID=A0A955RJV1_9BACT|nr:SIMPL domain-containing protein [Candidatus Dojkabacteria bacterium]
MRPAKHVLFLFFAKATYVFLLVLGVAALTTGIIYYSVEKATTEFRYPQSFSVEGRASKKVSLDTADITLGVHLEDESVTAVQEEAGTIYNDAIEKIKAVGIPEEDIQTQGYNVNEKYDPEREIDEPVMYQIDLALKVSVRNTKPEDQLISEVVNAASSAGFNKVNNLRFYLDDYQAVQDEIKEEAIADAKARAEREANAAGLTLGDVRNMYSGGYYPYYDDYSMRSMEAGGSADFATPESLPTVEFQPGQTEVTANVTLEYEILY